MKDLVLVKAIKEYVELCLSELSEGYNDFCKGQRYAYVDMLEMLQGQLTEEERAEVGLNYRVEERFPIK